MAFCLPIPCKLVFAASRASQIFPGLDLDWASISMWPTAQQRKCSTWTYFWSVLNSHQLLVCHCIFFFPLTFLCIHLRKCELLYTLRLLHLHYWLDYIKGFFLFGHFFFQLKLCNKHKPTCFVILLSSFKSLQLLLGCLDLSGCALVTRSSNSPGMIVAGSVWKRIVVGGWFVNLGTFLRRELGLGGRCSINGSHAWWLNSIITGTCVLMTLSCSLLDRGCNCCSITSASSTGCWSCGVGSGGVFSTCSPLSPGWCCSGDRRLRYCSSGCSTSRTWHGDGQCRDGCTASWARTI